MIFPFVSVDGIRAGLCDVERYGNLIIVTELKENTAMSVTNAIEYIATQYANQHGIELNDLVVVERYDERSYSPTRKSNGHNRESPNLSLVKLKVGVRMGRTHLTSPEWEFINDETLRVLRWAHSLEKRYEIPEGQCWDSLRQAVRL